MNVQRFKTWIPQSIGGSMLDMAVPASDFDRILAERDALQQRLNVLEEENDRLRSEMRGYVIQYHASIGNTEHHEDCQRDLIELENRS